MSLARNTVNQLKQNNEDLEWYPTTDEILCCMWDDLAKSVEDRDDRRSYSSDKDLQYRTHYSGEERPKLLVDSFLDIGAGDGRVMLNIPERKYDIVIANTFGVEKATFHADNLINDGVWLLGRDYMNITLIDKKHNIVFSNPPYSIFKPWCEKLLNEVEAQYIYLVIPQRWKNDEHLSELIKNKGAFEVVGSFDFTEGAREARAKVDLIKITKNVKEESLFSKWVTANIGDFKKTEEELEVREGREKKRRELELHQDMSATLINSYNDDMQHLLKTYRALNEVDFGLLEQLNISRDIIIGNIATSIKNLKYKYWQMAFDNMTTFKTRLTYSTSSKILSDMKAFEGLDFNDDNIRNIIIWVVKNFNNHSEKQMVKAFNDMTYFGKVNAYKSNEKWTESNWRYENGMPAKYSLDYRVVTTGSSLGRNNFNSNDDIYWGYNERSDNLVSDLSVVGHSLGFPNKGLNFQIDFGKKYEILQDNGKVLLTFRMYKNKNLHLQLDKEFLKKFNIEVGKLNNWIKKPSDIQEEFNMSEDEAKAYFSNSQLRLMDATSVKLLG